MSNLMISPIYIFVNVVLIIALAYRVAMLRRKYRIGLGDGGNKELARAISTHANAIENMPMLFFIMVMVELNGGLAWVLHATGILLTIARIWHAWDTSHHSGKSSGRYYGTVLSWNYALGMGLYAVLLGYST